MRSRLLLALSALVLAGLLVPVAAVADEVVLAPARDATLYFDPDGDLANGAGQHLFTGRGNENKRALLAFDLAAVPQGSVVESVELSLHMSKTIVPGIGHDVYRVLRAWNEGPSDAPGQEGAGGVTEVGDVTWPHAVFPDDFWSSPGGDVASDPSANLLVDGVGFYTFGSTPGLVADVQQWVDDPASNHGWQIRGLESFLLRSAKRWDSREHPEAARRPSLRVVFTPPALEIPALAPASLAALALLLLAAGLGALRRGVFSGR